MQEWWEALSGFEKVFWYISIPFSIILVIQIVLTFIGLDGSSSDVGEGLSDGSGLDLDIDTDVDFDVDVDVDIDIDADPSSNQDIAGHDTPMFSFFTFRNFVAFFAVFGWAGIVGIHNDFGTAWTIVFAIVLGLAMMFIVSGLFYFMHRMVGSGTMNIRNALNQVGNVYIPIKANAANTGKIQVNIQDSIREMSAITRKDEDLPTGTVVRVTGIVSGNILVVEKLKK